MQVILGAPYNLYTTTLDTTEKTLIVSNVIGYDLIVASLASVYSTTASKSIATGSNIVNCERTLDAGLPKFTYTFTEIDEDIADGDTLVILLNIPDTMGNYSILSYIASETA